MSTNLVWLIFWMTREFIIEMDPPCMYSLAAIKLQKLMTWLGTEVQVSCTMVNSGLLHEVHCQREERRQEIKVSPEGSEPQATISMGIHSNNLLDQMVDRVMGCMNQEVRLESLIQQRPDVSSIPSVCKFNATERMIGPERMGLMNRHPWKPTKGRTHFHTVASPLWVVWTLISWEPDEGGHCGSLCGHAHENTRGLGPTVLVFEVVETLKKKY